MKRFLIFLVVLGVAVLGLYIWWQRAASGVITEQVKNRAREFFVNTSGLEVTNDPVVLTSLRSARVPKIVISGKNLQVKNGPMLDSAKLVLTNIEVAGPPFDFTKIGGGSYSITANDNAVTSFLRKRGVRLTVVRIPMDTVSVSFSKKTGTTLTGAFDINLPLYKKRVPLRATGRLKPSSEYGMIDFQLTRFDIVGVPTLVENTVQTQARELVKQLNPIIDISEWPLFSDVRNIYTQDGTVTVKGLITGLRK